MLFIVLNIMLTLSYFLNSFSHILKGTCTTEWFLFARNVDIYHIKINSPKSRENRTQLELFLNKFPYKSV